MNATGNTGILVSAIKRALLLIVAAIEEYQGLHVDKRRVRIVTESPP